MNIKPAPHIEAFSGKMEASGQGVVAMPYAGRTIGRVYSIPTNPNTNLQQNIRILLAQAAVAFKSLTATQKSNWATLGKELKRRGRLGLEYTPSAIQTHNMINMYRLLNAQSVSATAPTYEDAPGAEEAVAEVVAGNLEISVSWTTVPSGGLFAIRPTPAIGSTTRNARDNELRYITDPTDESIVSASASPDTYALAQDNFSVIATDSIGIEVITLTSGYIPVARLFERNVVVGP